MSSFHFNKLLLASASPRRKRLLEAASIPFEVFPAQVEEFEDHLANPKSLVEHNARLKAQWVADQHPEALVLAADTTVALKERLFNKPQDLEEAYAMLRALSGKTHQVYTGVCLLSHNHDVKKEWVSTALLTFKAYDDAVIKAYFEAVNPFDKAGAYAIHNPSTKLILEHCEGSIETVMGLPIAELLLVLKSLGLSR